MQKNDVKNVNPGSTGTQVKQPNKDDQIKNPAQKPGSSQSRTQGQDEHLRPSQSPRTEK